MNEVILKMDNVHANYGLVPALRGVSLHLNKGEAVVLIGNHGCGKTAVLKAICGLLPVVGGKVLFEKSFIHKLPPEEVVSRGISYIDEMKLLFSSMSVIDNLILGSYHLSRKERRERIEQDIQNVYKLFPVLKERRKQYAGSLSGGEQQMLAIGRALMASPKLLLLDCPTLGLAPKLVEKVVSVIAELKECGVTILLVDQKIQQVINIIERGYIMMEGKVIQEGSPKELISIEERHQAHLVK